MLSTKDYSVSVWQDIDAPNYPPLLENIQTDVCVIGAGIAGLTTAYLLTKAGLKVVVIDDGLVGGRQTVRTTAHLSNAFDDRYFELQRLRGVEESRLVAESHTWAIDKIREIANVEGIKCDYQSVDGYLFLAPEHHLEYLGREHEAAHEAGLRDVELLSRFPDARLDFGPCLRFPQQARFHPSQYMLGLASRIEKYGGKIFQHTRATEIIGGAHSYVKTKLGKRIDAKFIVVATNVPVNTIIKVHMKQAAYRSYAIACAVPAGAYPDCLLWDTGDPYHYVRKQTIDDKDYLIIGGEDHKTGQIQHGLHPHLRLYRWAQTKFPYLQKVEFSWSGQIIESVDGMAYIGVVNRAEPNVFIATADSGHGMTHGTMAGRIISDGILGQTNPWSEIYDPHRITLGALGEYLSENMNTAWQYRDWLSAPKSCSATELPKKGGAVCSQGLRKNTMFRDEQGIVHGGAAVCTHMGGIVRWNEAEKTWDCPCHGSRFSAKGEVINGPALTDLRCDVPAQQELLVAPENAKSPAAEIEEEAREEAAEEREKEREKKREDKKSPFLNPGISPAS